ncbi:MAG: hypothetical protein ACR2P5_03885 [Gammaproteobacteria bacterium]
MPYSASALQKLLPGIGLAQTDIAAAQPRNKYKNDQERALRGLSWLRAAETAKNPDARLICALIALNSLYAVPPRKTKAKAAPEDGAAENDIPEYEREHERIDNFIDKLVKHDKGGILIDFLRGEQRDNVEALFASQYLSNSYWRSFHIRNIPTKAEWVLREGAKITEAEKCLEERNPALPLKHIIHRVRVLRNQLIHGESGFGDYYNRPQVSVCAAFMPPLVGRMLAIVVQTGKYSVWGVVPYPPQGEKPNQRTFGPVSLRGKGG